MITNERQYRISRRKLATLKEAALRLAASGNAQDGRATALTKLNLEALQSEIEVLTGQLREYDSLRSGEAHLLEAASLAELPTMLIRARIAQRLSQRQLADRLGLKEQQIQRYESEGYASASLHRLKAVAGALRLRITERAEILQTPTRIGRPQPPEQDWSKFPVKEMYRRGWFAGFDGTLDQAVAASGVLVSAFASQANRTAVPAFHRKSVRSGREQNLFAVWAWECRVLILAADIHRGASHAQQALEPEWLGHLARLSRDERGPRLAKAALQEVGIALVIEPHLSETYLDGAAILGTTGPVIGLTLRLDRLDNFWFVLFHELIHVMRHLKKGKLDTIIDDLESESTGSIELEADTLALNALIPHEKWLTALPRYTRDAESVKAFAAELGISPAIVAGRIRHEASTYVILGELVGQGAVRRQFPEVAFGM